MERWQKNLGLGIIASIVGTFTLEAIHEAVVDWRQEKERERLRKIRDEEAKRVEQSVDDFAEFCAELTKFVKENDIHKGKEE